MECDSYHVRRFLENGGERGPQIAIIPPGTYRINTAFFTVSDAGVLQIEDNKIGVVTTQEGTPLPTGEIAGKEIGAHNMFQNGQAFLNNGGFKGLQEQVLLAGQYFINPRFATIEIKPMTEVPIAQVGVVIAYVGAAGVDVTGETFRHGNLVTKGQKGVWVDPLDPGKYYQSIRTKLRCTDGERRVELGDRQKRGTNSTKVVPHPVIGRIHELDVSRHPYLRSARSSHGWAM